MRKLLIALAAALTAFVGFLVSPLSTSLPDTVFLSEMTWLEVEEAMRQGKTGVIVPTAGLEQNGVHAVLGKHRYIVRHTAERIARTLRTALVAPVIDYVPEGDIEPPSGHMRFTGTVSISPSLFGQILESTARSLRAHGFERIYFLGDSLGNQKPQAEVAAKLNREWTNETTRVLHIGDYYAKNGQLEWLKAKGETEFSIGGHAGIRDTSELLAIRPDGVRPYMIRPRGGLHLGVTGASGDAAKASAKIGQRMIDLKVEAALRQIRELNAAKIR
jgi:creatinine amidohydrolase/Fe(II)-dependent formamide hydrolase-like protein